jgi:hypothetical protein
MMRAVLLIAVLSLAGCSGSPESLGITGPGARPPVHPDSDDSTVGNPGLPDSGGAYAPSYGPNPAGGRYFNYN